MIRVSPSILSCDFANLEREICAVASEGADLIHVDVMDGHFVPNITIGIPVVAALKRISPLPLDVHLMISDPLFYTPAFVGAGSDLLTFHLESAADPVEVIRTIRQNGAAPGISIKPKTPAEAVFPYLDLVDMVLVMTVEPGFGGQSFMADMLPKIEALRRRRTELGLAFSIEVDGGIDPNTAVLSAAAGADTLVAGSAIFGRPPYQRAIADIRAAAQAAYRSK